VKKRAYLFGPFVGELMWELYRFVPHFIHLRKENPGLEFIVLTRQARFDLYGKYAKIMVPLKIKNDKEEYQDCFKLNGLSLENYNKIVQHFKGKYRKEYSIGNHVYPDVFWRYNVKWQFPRHLMKYDFAPRKRNIHIINTLIKDQDNVVFIDKADASVLSEFDSLDYNPHFDPYFSLFLAERLNEKSSHMGCLIHMIKNVKFVVANIESIPARFALLLKTPVISINETALNDEINLLNPLRTPVISCKNLKEGIEIYENNIRS
jgi:hypothetical protein